MSDDSAAHVDPFDALHPELKKLLPSKEVIYDAIMAPIEVDLLSVNLPTLTEKYADESDDDRTARMARYKEAFLAYDTAFGEWIAELSAAVASERKEAFVKAEVTSKEEEEGLMSDLESAFEDADPPSPPES